MKLRNLLTGFSLLGLILLSFQNCSKDSEILATYDGGTVTRGELLFILEASKQPGQPEQPVGADVQANLLENIAIQKIILGDMVKSGKLSQADLDNVVETIGHSMILKTYLDEYVKKNLKNSPMEFLEMQMALVRGEDPVATKQKAEDLKNKLNKMSDSEIAKEITSVTSDSNRKPVAGKLDPFCSNCAQTPFDPILKQLANIGTGEFITYSENDDSNIVYVVRALKKEKVHPERLPVYLTKKFEAFQKEAEEYAKANPDAESKQAIEYLTQGNQADKAREFSSMLSKQYEQGLYERESNRLREATGIVLATDLPNRLDQLDPKTFGADRVLYTTKEGVSFKWIELVAEYEKLPGILKREMKDEKQRVGMLLSILQSIIIPRKMAEASPEIADVKKTDSFRYQLEQLRWNVGLNVFTQEISAIPLSITDEQVRDTYEAGKLYAYSEQSGDNPRDRRPIPFASVRERVKSDLEKSQRELIVKDKATEYKTTYNLLIANDRLKEITI
ncbi:hypothetical protein P3G55_09430 [Leptospira sp. 96542]|nr:hypothetical protein [Leptospira sp. 96542]